MSSIVTVSAGAPKTGTLGIDPDLLPALAASRPTEALLVARSLLASGPDDYSAALARQAVGIVLRDRGDVAMSIAELRLAKRLSERAGPPARTADVLATLGATLISGGDIRNGLAALDEAIRVSTGRGVGRALMRRGWTLLGLGRHSAALADVQRALTVLRRFADELWTARTVMLRAEIYLAVGDTVRAAVDYAAAEALFAQSGQELEHAMARHNLGRVALARGDLPTALTYLDEAERRYDALDAIVPELALDRCMTLLAAGLATDALREADRGAAALARRGGDALRTADLVYAAAGAALAVPDPTAARSRGERARRAFGRQERTLARLQADVIVLQARFAVAASAGAAPQAAPSGTPPVRRSRLPVLGRRADDIAARLDTFGAIAAVDAHLTAGRIARELGRPEDAERHFAIVARTRHRGSALTRSVGWLAQALAAQTRGSARGTFAACARGLDVLDEHRATLGATELRASTTAHGAELAHIAQRQALLGGDSRRLLLWSERWRATSLALTPIRGRASGAADDEDVAAHAHDGDLAALRTVTRQLETARDAARDVARDAARDTAPDAARDQATRAQPTVNLADLDRERHRLEARVRARAMRSTRSPGPAGASGTAATRSAPRFDVDELLARLGPTQLIELTEIDGRLHMLTAVNGRVRHDVLGVVPEQEVRTARSMLAAIGLGSAPRHAPALLEQIGARLERLLLGPVADRIGDGPVLVVPTGRFQATPWSLLPSLRRRVVSVAPSALTWLRAVDAAPPPHRRIALVTGPGLGSGGAEVPLLAARYPGATVVADGTATAERALAAMDGAWLAHIAAHGTFRADNPMFSSLRLDDGQLNVHDFERLHRAPYRIVLSSCDSGVGAPLGADELLGLVSSLISLGAAGVLASVVRVNDMAAVALMTAVHAAVADGTDFAQALLAARTDGPDDPVSVATALSFTAFGA